MKKNIVITGISSGIGRDALRLLHSNGYHIYGSVRKEADAKSLTEAYPQRFTPLIFDVQDQNVVNQEAKVVFETCDRIDALINNAGIAVPGPLEFVTESDFEKQMDVNLKSVRRITNTFLPLLGTAPDFKGTSGRIINISSISGLFSSPFNGVYSISKHALESMTDVYRRELRRYGIKVMAVEPGPIKTKIWGKNLDSMTQFAETDYYYILRKADKMIENTEKNALPVTRTSNVILKCITKKRPKTRYIVHKNAFVFKIVANYLPDKLVDWFIHRSLSKGNRHRPV